eukprot:m.635887 g.635887  ORF g.635887 m.635887 type:complete len:61 (-) comp22587_c0_seq20:234-416(-)
MSSNVSSMCNDDSCCLPQSPHRDLYFTEEAGENERVFHGLKSLVDADVGDKINKLPPPAI